MLSKEVQRTSPFASYARIFEKSSIPTYDYMKFVLEYRIVLLWVLSSVHEVGKHTSAQGIIVSNLDGSVVDKVGQSIPYATIFIAHIVVSITGSGHTTYLENVHTNP